MIAICYLLSYEIAKIGKLKLLIYLKQMIINIFNNITIKRFKE